MQLRNELQDHIVRTKNFDLPMISHPLVMDLYHENQHERYNKMFEAKTELLKEMLENKEYSGYIHLHEKPYRINALDDLVLDEHLATDTEIYWELVISVYTGSENNFQCLDQWIDIFSDFEPHFRTSLMSTDDLDFYTS